MLVVFEGPDGTGKSTLAKALQQHLAINGEQWDLLAFPGNDNGSLGQHVYEIHHQPRKFGITHISPESLQMLHIAAHIDSIENRIKPALQEKKNILLDRFWWSTWVYGLNSGVDQQALAKMIELEIYHWQDILPDMVILVDRARSLKLQEEEKKWHKLRSYYHDLIIRERDKYPIFHIDNNETFEKMLEKVVKLVKKNHNIKRTGSKHISPQMTINQEGIDPELMSNQLALPFMDIGETKNKSTLKLVHYRIYPVIPTKVYNTYWYFAAARQNIFFKRFEGCPPPWTDDPILSQYKFTNAYRASDRVSQYLIKNVIYQGSQSINELFFRILLFKVFNRISTWELLKREFGELTFFGYSFEIYDRVLTQALKKGEAIFSAAYIMPSGGKNSPYAFKHQVFLKLIEKMIADQVPDRLAVAPSMKSAFEILRSYPLIGDFLAYQYVIDINYSTLTNFSESDFVMPGPGARNGICKCFEDFGGLSEIDLIRLVTDIQEEEFSRLGIDFKSLWGRRLQLIDCQNLFCEVDKYSRVAHPDIGGINNRNRIKQIYRQSPPAIDYWYPPKWGINDNIQISKIS